MRGRPSGSAMRGRSAGEQAGLGASRARGSARGCAAAAGRGHVLDAAQHGDHAAHDGRVVAGDRVERRVRRHHLADHQVIEQAAQGGQLHLDRLHPAIAAPGFFFFDVSSDDHRPDLLQPVQAAPVAPTKEIADRAVVSGARVVVFDFGGEEFLKAPRGVLSLARDVRGQKGQRVGDGGHRTGVGVGLVVQQFKV